MRYVPKSVFPTRTGPQHIARWRKIRMTTKDGPYNYYKGTGTGRMGWHTKHGGYKIDYNRVRTYVVPPLKDFKLTPFVSETIRPIASDYGPMQPRFGSTYLQRWTEENGED